MAERNPPSWVAAGSHTAENDRMHTRALLDLIGLSGVTTQGIVAAGDLAVTARATPNMSVDVAAGSAFITSTETGGRGSYHVWNDATHNLVVGAADATNPRIDLVVARVRDAQYSGSTSAWALEIVQGTPAASPAVPATPVSSLALARVAVAANASSIVAGNITDLRVRVGDWVSYTPVWSSTGTAPNLGNGSIVGRYRLHGRTLFIRILLTMGSTTTYGTAGWTISLPSGIVANGVQAIMANFITSVHFHGIGSIDHGSNLLVPLVDNGTAGGGLQFPTATVPGAWASGHRINMSGIIEVQ